MNKLLLTAALAVSAVCASPSIAQTTIDFDDGTSTDFADQGAVFTGFSVVSNTFGGAVDVPSSPNFVNVDVSGATIRFVDPTSGAATTSDGFGFTVAGLNSGDGFFAGALVRFLGLDGTNIGNQTFSPVGPNEGRSQFTFTTALTGISSVLFTRIENPNGPALFPIDDVTFNLNAVSGVVPEPATWGLMIVGVGLVGGAMRRRRSVSVRFA